MSRFNLARVKVAKSQSKTTLWITKLFFCLTGTLLCMKKYIVVGLLIASLFLSPVFVGAQTQTSQQDQINTLIRLLQSLVQLLQQQLSMLQLQGSNLNNSTNYVSMPTSGDVWTIG